ncbi:MAG: hypothetical protein HY321_19100 [Armatimonadetes bacterium]|nr:hypothetical protein [Armatimonadota bacterium]
MIAIASATQRDSTLVIEVCPVYQDGCACAPDAAHPTFEFQAQPPEGRTPEEWAEACGREALRLVQAAIAAREGEPLPGLAGLTL